MSVNDITLEEEPGTGNVRPPERSIYSDYTEVSPWNPSHMRKYKPVQKPFHKFFSGTMPDLHYRIRNYSPLLFCCGILRALGMWMGVSNPLLGLFVLAASLLDSYYNTIYMCWGMLWMMIWSLVMKVPRELIYNGLYPVQGILLGFFIYFMQPQEMQLEALLPNLVYLIFLELLNLFFFQALCTFFVKVLNVSPMMIAPTIVAIIFKAVRKKTLHLENIQLPAQADIQNYSFFNGTFKDFSWEVGMGVSNMVFSYNQWSGFILTIGMLIASPIIGVMSWVGAATATVTAVLIAPQWADVESKAYIFPAVITCGSIAGTFFVLNIHSFLVGVAASALTTLVTISLSSFFEPVPCWITGALGGYMVTIAIYSTAGSFTNLIPVELISMTTPEDHLRRYFLSKRILSDLKISHGYKRLTPDNFRSVEHSILPILMCSYAKLGDIYNLKNLLDLGADPNISNYNGRCALHIAAAENQKEVVYILLRYQADVNQADYNDETALTSALEAGHYDLALYIYRKGGRIFFKKARLASLLCYMVHEDEIIRLTTWLKCGADICARDYHKRTPLQVAISQNKGEMITLLQKKVDVSKIRRNTRTEASIVFENKAELVDIDYDKLQQRGDRVNCINKPTTVIVNGDILKAVITTIVEDEAKKEALLPSIMCQLAFIKDNDSLKELISDVCFNTEFSNLCDFDLRTPLHIASFSGNFDAVKLLLWNKADINAVDRFGLTPLLTAIRNGRTEVAHYLRKNGAELGMSQQAQIAELCWAVCNSEFEILSSLIENGIDVTLKDYDGRSFMDVARGMQNKNVIDHIEMLLRTQGMP